MFCNEKKWHFNNFIIDSKIRLCPRLQCLRPDPAAQSVACLTADPGVTSLFQHCQIDHEIISMVIPPFADSRRVVVSYKQKYVHAF